MLWLFYIKMLFNLFVMSANFLVFPNIFYLSNLSRLSTLPKFWNQFKATFGFGSQIEKKRKFFAPILLLDHVDPVNLALGSKWWTISSVNIREHFLGKWTSCKIHSENGFKTKFSIFFSTWRYISYNSGSQPWGTPV